MTDFDFLGIVETLADFGYDCIDDSDIIAKLSSISSSFQLSDDDLVDELVAFATNMKKTTIDLQLVDALEPELTKKLQKTIEVKSAVKPKQRPVLNDIRQANLDVSIAESEASFMEVDKSVEVSGKYATFAPVSGTHTNVKYLARTGQKSVVTKQEGALYVIGNVSGQCNINLVSPPVDPYFATDKTAAVIDAKCSRMARMADRYQEAHPEVTQFTRNAVAEFDQIYVYGEVVPDSSESLQGNTVHIMLDDEDGTLLKVDISQLENVTLFPGQIAAFKGINETGDCLVASEQLSCPLLKPDKIEQPAGSPGHVRIFAASGPFCSSEGCGYEPLCDLLDVVKMEMPHVLILMGPFVDRANKFINRPQFDLTYHELFDRMITRIAQVLDGTNVELILQPSPGREGVSYGAFPTAAFSLPNEALKILGKRVQVVGDPAVISVAGVYVALTGSEIVAHLSKSEWHRSSSKENSDRIARLSAHILQQASLYPLCPSTIPSNTAETLKVATLNSAPQMIIIPSILPPSIKTIGSTIICNPGPLLKGSSGTYLRADVNVAVCMDAEQFPDCGQWQIVKI